MGNDCFEFAVYGDGEEVNGACARCVYMRGENADVWGWCRFMRFVELALDASMR